MRSKINKITLNIRNDKPVMEFFSEKEMICSVDILKLAQLDGFETVKSKDELLNLLSKWANKIEATYNKVSFRQMRNKWASYSTKRNLVFNNLLIGMPKIFAEYVIVHELLHFKIPNHGKLFKVMLNKYLPSWEEFVYLIVANKEAFAFCKEAKEPLKIVI